MFQCRQPQNETNPPQLNLQRQWLTTNQTLRQRCFLVAIVDWHSALWEFSAYNALLQEVPILSGVPRTVQKYSNVHLFTFLELTFPILLQFALNTWNCGVVTKNKNATWLIKRKNYSDDAQNYYFFSYLSWKGGAELCQFKAILLRNKIKRLKSEIKERNNHRVIRLFK